MCFRFHQLCRLSTALKSQNMSANNNLETINWKIGKFSSISVNKSPFSAPNNRFYLWLKSITTGLFNEDCVTVYLIRNKPYSENIEVEWTISVIDQDGNKRYTKVSEIMFSNQIKMPNQPTCGGIYFINRNYLLNPTNGLLMNDTLTIYCEIKTSNNAVNNEKFLLFQSTLRSMKLIEDYQSLLESCKHSDVVCVVGKKEFKLHKAILTARSPVFAAMFDSDLSENKQNRVEIPDVEVEVFEELLRFIYTGKIPTMDQYAWELFVASDKYQLNSLKDSCESSLSASLTIETVAKVITLADMHSARQLKSKCVQFFIKNATKVMKTEGWKALATIKPDLIMELFEELATKAEPLLK